jgi:hypothetical protein
MCCYNVIEDDAKKLQVFVGAPLFHHHFIFSLPLFCTACVDHAGPT